MAGPRALGLASTRRSREVLVTPPQGLLVNTKLAIEVAKEIKGTIRGRDCLSSARKLPSGAYALTFRSEEAKEA